MCKIVNTNLDDGILNNTEWIQRWVVGDTGFHQKTHDLFLDKHVQGMLNGEKVSIFVPLCGKTPDLKWMYDQGHTICGIEIAEQAVKEFFEENKIEVDIVDVGKLLKLYKSKDGRLNLYVGDLFDLSREICGQFDMIWDSRSLVAINVADRKTYLDLLLSLLKSDGHYYLSTIDYDPNVWPGPPHTIPDKDVQDMYGDCCNIEMVEEIERTNQNVNTKPDTVSNAVTEQSPPRLSSAGAAIKTSSYVFDRWYHVTFK